MDTGYSKTSEVFHKASKSCRFLKDFRSLGATLSREVRGALSREVRGALSNAYWP